MAMTAVLNPPQEITVARVVLTNISWETYEKLLTDLTDRSAPRLTYDRGTLEIMSPTVKHEALNEAIRLLVNAIAEEVKFEARGLGSATFKREDLARGFEPDACYYIGNERLIRGRDEIDLTVDPPPDLIIEIDITSPSLSKFPIFAQLGVPEIWRYDGERLRIFRLEKGAYIESETSVSVPFVDAGTLTHLLKESLTLSRLEWLNKVRVWARQQMGKQ